MVACVGTAGIACALGAAGTVATTSWGNQALDNAGQPVLQATTQINWGEVARDGFVAGVMGGIGGGSSVLRQNVGLRSYAAIGALVNGSLGALSTAFDPHACASDIAKSFLYNAAVGGIFSTTSYYTAAVSKGVFEPFVKSRGMLTYSTNIIGGIAAGLVSGVANNILQHQSPLKDTSRAMFWGAVSGAIQSYDYLASGSPAAVRRTKAEMVAQQLLRGEHGRTVWETVLDVNRSRSGEFFGDLVSGVFSLMFPSH